MSPSALDRARKMWATLVRVPAAFPTRGSVNVVVSPDSGLSPPQWVGIVALDGGILAAVPDSALREPVKRALLDHVRQPQSDLSPLRKTLPAVDVLGPATLAYLDAEDFAAVHAHADVETLPADHGDVRALVDSVDARDADESALRQITSAAFAIRRGRSVVAAAGYRPWLDTVAHLSVLTAPEYRGRGFARMVASAAVADALANRLLPQWRARPEASRRVAATLGFREYGSQASFRLNH
jgi:GNAT superfamily N-acetyltransferase